MYLIRFVLVLVSLDSTSMLIATVTIIMVISELVLLVMALLFKSTVIIAVRVEVKVIVDFKVSIVAKEDQCFVD